MNNSNKFQENFKELGEKILYRLNKITEQIDYIPGPYMFYQYSDNPVSTLSQGVILSHIGQQHGIFGDSLVLMTEFVRNQSIIGLIINKNTISDNKTYWIGGPCEPSVITILHNVPNVPQAREIISGVYQGGQLTQEQKNNPNNLIRQYYGYASWFEGQLDGEVRNGGWDVLQNQTANDVFTNEIVENNHWY